jgi:urease accessory protein
VKPQGSQLRRVERVERAGQWDARAAADRVVLDAGERHLRRTVLTGEGGGAFLVDLPRPVKLRDGDAFLLDDGTLIAVAGAPEPLMELAAPAALDAVRLAWHLGNRHADVEIAGGNLRIRRDHVLEEMAAALGAKLTALNAPFDPETSTPQDHHGHGRHDHG